MNNLTQERGTAQNDISENSGKREAPGKAESREETRWYKDEISTKDE
jgi:hypothetical protein